MAFAMRWYDSAIRLISSQVLHPTSPTHSYWVPGRMSNRKGLRRP